MKDHSKNSIPNDLPSPEQSVTHTQVNCTVYPKKYAHGFCFAVLCCGYTLTDFPISIRLTSLALWQSNDCPSASKATLMNMDKYFKWIHYERLHNHNKAKHNKTVCIFLGIYCTPNMHGLFTLCFAVVTPFVRSWFARCLPVSFRVASLVLGQLCTIELYQAIPKYEPYV